MTKFEKEKFIIGNEFVFYGERKIENFIARFKYRRGVSKAKFLNELMANHTVEGYFAKRAEGMAPLAILREVNPGFGMK